MKNFVAFPLDAAARPHIDRNSTDRLDFVPVFILERDINRNRINDFTVLSDRILHAVVIKDAGSRNGLKTHRRAFGEVSFIRMNRDMDTAGRPFKILCRHRSLLFLKVCRVDSFVCKIRAHRRDKPGFRTYSLAVRVGPTDKTISVIRSSFRTFEGNTVCTHIDGFGRAADLAAFSRYILDGNHTLVDHRNFYYCEIGGINDFAAHVSRDRGHKHRALTHNRLIGRGPVDELESFRRNCFRAGRNCTICKICGRERLLADCNASSFTRFIKNGKRGRCLLGQNRRFRRNCSSCFRRNFGDSGFTSSFCFRPCRSAGRLCRVIGTRSFWHGDLSRSCFLHFDRLCSRFCCGRFLHSGWCRLFCHFCRRFTVHRFAPFRSEYCCLRKCCRNI